MRQELRRIEYSAESEIKAAQTLEELEERRIQFLGRERGALTIILRRLKDLPPEERASVGAEANRLRKSIETLLAEREKALKKTGLEAVLKKERLDVTRPGKKSERGHLHPITHIRRRLESIFASMGFSVAEGPEVETEFYNFDALNLPETHPAREMQDTWWLRHPAIMARRNAREIKSRLLLRTQVTAIQVRFMERHTPPFRIIMPGTVFRREATDASHEVQFTQMDGLMVDKKVSLANLKGIMQMVMRELFGQDVKLRLRAGYFPFVEPGVEMDMGCLACRQHGCSVCQRTGWIEIFPGGVVHPNVFRAAGYGPGQWQGIAFDIGLDRIAMMKYKIPDIRLFHSGDLRFLKQF